MLAGWMATLVTVKVAITGRSSRSGCRAVTLYVPISLERGVKVWVKLPALSVVRLILRLKPLRLMKSFNGALGTLCWLSRSTAYCPPNRVFRMIDKNKDGG